MEEFEEMYLLENSYRNLIRRRHRRVWVNEIFMYRKQLGEYHHLFEELKLQQKWDVSVSSSVSWLGCSDTFPVKVFGAICFAKNNKES